jgi:membrane protease YdiL (CAAX protease family)
MRNFLGLPGSWARLPVTLRAIVCGLVVGMAAANVWPLLLLNLGAPIAAAVEIAFLAVYVWWARGAGWPASTHAARADAFRAAPLTARQWLWGLIGAVAFAVTVHAAIVVLFRLTPYPAEAFHKGYDFSFVPTLPLRWLAVVVSALSAGVCEEVGFRGYMQRPIEKRHGAPIAILVSSLLFMTLHLNKDWATIGMTPIVLGAGVLLGAMAWASRSLVFCMIGHTLMDIGLFAYWWTQIAGVFGARPISQTGVDGPFLLAAIVLILALSATVLAIWRLRGMGRRMGPDVTKA